MTDVSDGLQSFFYLLLRDHLPAGPVEKLVADASVGIGKEIRFSNEHLGAYAAELRDRVLGKNFDLKSVCPTDTNTTPEKPRSQTNT